MTGFESWPFYARALMQVGAHIWLQSAFVLLLGLLIARMASRRGPVMQTAILRSSLSAVAVGAILILLAGGSPVSLINLSLPSARLGLDRASIAPDAELRAAASASQGKPAKSETISKRTASSQTNTIPKASVQATGSQTSVVGMAYVAAASIWISGTLFLLVVTLLGSWHIRMIRNTAQPVADGQAREALRSLSAELGLRQPALLASRDVDSPFAVSGRTPAILLPEGFAEGASMSLIRAVLCHELWHIARRDCAWKTFGRIVCVAFWPQPLLWTLCRKLEQCSEEASDALVIHKGAAPREYAQCLMDVAERWAPTRAEGLLGVGVVGYRSSLGRRIETILSSRGRHLPANMLARATACAGSFIVMAVGLALVTVGAADRAAIANFTQEASGSGTIKGRVINADGSPAAGVIVRAALKGDAPDPSVPPFSGATTKDNGTYELPGLGSAEYYVFIYPDPKAGMVARGYETVRATDGNSARASDIVLSGGVLVTGVVRDIATGAPIPGVRVGCEGPALPVGAMVTPTNAKTDLDGRYTLRTAPGKNAIFLLVPRPSITRGPFREASRQLPDRIEMREVVGRDGQTIATDFKVNSKEFLSVTIRGTVVYADGKPAEGVTVCAQNHNVFENRSIEIDSGMSWAECVTAKDGTYALTGLADCPYNVTLNPVELPTGYTCVALEGIKAPFGKSVTAPNIVLITGATVTGTVVDEKTGKPLQGVHVMGYGPSRPKSTAMCMGSPTDAQGRYRLRVAPGDNDLYLGGPFKGSFFTQLPDSYKFKATLKPGETRTHSFEVDSAVFDLRH